MSATPPGQYGGPPQPPVPPYGAPPPPKRRRPSKWWFAVAGGLVVLALAIGITSIVLTVKAFAETDATVEADGTAHRVTVGTERDRLVWVHRDSPATACSIIDTATGEPVQDTGAPGATYTKDFGGQGWVGDRTFDPGSGDLEVTCPEAGGPIQIGPEPEFGRFFGGILIGILVPLLLGGLGFVMLLVVTVLYATGRPRAS